MTCDWMSGDGGVYTNIDNLRKWAVFLAGKSSYGAGIPNKMRTRVLPTENYGYGLYPTVRISRRSFTHHGGTWRGSKSAMYWEPASQTFFFVLASHRDFDAKALARALIGIHYGP